MARWIVPAGTVTGTGLVDALQVFTQAAGGRPVRDIYRVSDNAEIPNGLVPVAESGAYPSFIIDSEFSEFWVQARTETARTQVTPSGGDIPDGTITYTDLDSALHTTLGLAETAVQPSRMVSTGDGLAGGGNLEEDLTLFVDTTSIATRAYVDASAQGLAPKATVRVATAAALPACTHLDGVLTADADGVLEVDGVELDADDRVLVKDQVLAEHNGIFDVTFAGTVDDPWVLTRSADMDVDTEFPNAYTFVREGTDNAGYGYVLQGSGPFIPGTTELTWIQFTTATAAHSHSPIPKADLALLVQASLDLADTAVQPTRSISTGTGMTGGGNLSADRTLAVDTSVIATKAYADSLVPGSRITECVINDYAGGVPDTLKTRGAISSGSTTVTINQTLFTPSHVGKTILIRGAGASGGMLKSTIISRTSSTVAVIANAASTTVTTPASNEQLNVAFGTDNTAAFIAARDDVLSRRITNPDGRVQLTAHVVLLAGTYMVTSQDAGMFSPVTGTSELLRGYTMRGVAPQSSNIVFGSTGDSTADPRNGNFFTWANRTRGAVLKDFSIDSWNPKQSFIYMFCSSSNDGTVYPLYGSGSQNRIFYDAIELNGNWHRGVGIDGDSNFNQCSEQRWDRVQLTNEVTFGDAFVHSGMHPSFTQSDQAVNYSFYDCNFEYAAGDLLKFNRGGHIHVHGGSWIIGIDTGGTGGPGAMFKMGNYSQGFNTKHLTCIGTRFELRDDNSKLLDTWWQGTSAHITFIGIGFSTEYLTTPAEWEAVTWNATGGSPAQTKFIQCELPGYHKADLGANQTAGRISYEGCNFRSWTTITPGASATFLRTDGTNTPKYRAVDCVGGTGGAIDAAN